MRVYWKEGLRLDSRDGNFKLKIGGRIQNDWAWLNEESDIRPRVGDQEDGTEFSRVRFYTAGSVYERMKYKLQFDFAKRDGTPASGGHASLKDAYLAIDLPRLGLAKAGHFKEPFSLEELTSSKYVTFMERGLPNAFAPARNTGLQLSSNAFDKRLTWAAGVFRDADSYGRGLSEGGCNGTARVTALPWYENRGEKLLHLGLAGSLRYPDDVRYRARPEANLADYFVDTGAMGNIDEIQLLGEEAALVLGPLSLQGEAIQADVDRNRARGVKFGGYYVTASYFLTGEHRKYKTSAGAFSRVKPKKDFLREGGWGAWEVATKYSRLDLSDRDIAGGRLSDITLGLNWHLNPNVRVMWNYVRADLNRTDDDGHAEMLLMRLQIDF